MIENYVPYHVHTYFSNCLINIDSVTRPEQYVAKAQEYGIKALSFSEHGNIFNWLGKKQSIEAAGMKYIHSAEVYVTRSIAPNESGEPTKIRDNYHCVLIARNFDGFQELNRLTSAAFNRDDGHFYYVPRITFDELKNTSDNILVTTACLGGILAKAEPDFRDDVLKFLKQNKRRCFLEVQHHRDFDQIELNKAIAELSRQYNIPMIAGTDTHALDDFAVECRAVMQRSKDVHFDGEDNFDLTFKSLDQLIYAYKKQNALSESEYLAAIDNTNKMADMVQPFTVDTTPKLPHISSDPDTEFDAAIAADLKEHPQLFEKHSEQEIYDRIATEKEVFQKTNSVEYMLLYRSIVKWCNGQDIYAGPGRGSAAGSLVSYIFGITEVDPLEYNLNFWRFMNPDRVSLCDIDRDYMSYDRDKLMEYLLRDHMGRDTIQTCKIITYNTLGLRGAIKDVGRALGMTPQQTDEISKQEVDGDVPPELRQQYPELFKYADGVLGTITAIGQHAAGVVITNNDNDLASNIGLSTNPAIPYPVSCIDMKQIDYCNYPKYDLLGLDYVGLINETCKRAGIPRLRPDTVNLDDDEVWNSIAKDTTLIFQFAEKYAQKYVQQILSPESMQESAKYDDHISRFNRLALASAMLRPGAASVRDEAAMGIYQEYDIPELNELLKPSMGTLVLQESLMEFLVKFCGYKPSESDYVRKCIAEGEFIQMASGRYSYKRIENVQQGDYVWCYDFEKQAIVARQVLHVFDNGYAETMKICLYDCGVELRCTPTHKLARLNHYGELEWVRADALKLYDVLAVRNSTGVDSIEYAQVTSLKIVGSCHVYDLEVEEVHNYFASNLLCHNCVSKKRQTDSLIPEIKSRFLEYTPAHYNVTLETAEKIIDPFLQTVLDSASYSFSWNHSVPYTMISYMSGWLRTHYPLEFLATAIDIFRDKPDHIESIMNYITIHEIKLTPARFGIARSYSTVDHESNSICQSIAPVKNVSVKTAETLYEISQSFDSPYFIDLLERTVGTGINKSMLESLIYISFFDRFGNQPELIRIMDMWQKWKDKKTFKPGNLAEFNTPDVVAFATNLNAKGKPLKTYTITDRAAFLHALEDGVKAANMPDYSYKFKFENELALLNRVESCTHNSADRFKLFISSMRPLKRKSDGGVWGYSVGAISIGSGRSTDLTIGESLFALHPITKGSVIHVARPDLNLRKSKSGYWTLYSYSVLEG